ncbi:MAG: SemiSWEET family transporter [Candidatus Diapherotrites archaeon]
MGLIFINFIKVAATIMGIVMSLGYFPQAYKVYKNKSSKDISLLAFVIFSLGTLTWFIYGLTIKDIPIILGFVLGVIGSWLVLVLSIIYRKRR